MPYDGRLLSGVTVLAAVIEAGTIVRASEALGLTASAVSRAVSRLEARIGARLLNRTTRSLTLTDEGRLFYERVGPHLDGIEEAAIEAAGSTNVVRGRLRINVDPFFSRIVLAGHVVTFLQQYPNVRLELIMRDQVGDLVADGFDLALRFGDPPSGSFVARKLVETRILTVASPGYIAMHGRPRILRMSPVTPVSLSTMPRTGGPSTGSFAKDVGSCRSISRRACWSPTWARC
jgi:DNA-binding transcriptional LysR family regulator